MFYISSYNKGKLILTNLDLFKMSSGVHLEIKEIFFISLELLFHSLQYTKMNKSKIDVYYGANV